MYPDRALKRIKTRTSANYYILHGVYNSMPGTLNSHSSAMQIYTCRIIIIICSTKRCEHD